MESPDIGLSKDPFTLPVSLIEEEEDEELQQETEEVVQVPPDLLKSYYFGCGPFHPKWLQVFANKKFFTFLLCLFAFLQGSIVSGFTSVVLSTIETRYQFTSAAVGFIAVSYDTTVTISVIFVSYFGGKAHKPRWLGISLIIMGIGAYIFASPQFLFGSYKIGSTSSLQFEVCNDERNITIDCSPSNDIAYAVYIFGNMLVAIGAAPLYTVGQAYIDEIVFPKYVSIHFGIYQMASVLGPAFGYGVGSAFLSIYVDPWIDTNLTPSDPTWVGAWWISFVFVGTLSILLSIPFLMYPKWLPDSHLVREERAKEMAKIYPMKYANEDSLTIVVKMFPVHIKRLLTNLSFIFESLAISILFILISGLVSFAPKYFENQFQLTATVAGLLSGGIGITAAALGVMTGALILYFTKIRGRKLAAFIAIVIALVIPFSPGFLLNCPNTEIAGITTPYADGAIEDNSTCFELCNCISSVFEPVCGNDDITYFSPCRAGCSEKQNDTFINCTCVTDSLYSNNSNISYDVILANNSTVSDGQCQLKCSYLIPFVIIMVVSLFLVFTSQIPHSYFTMRVVADDQRALALGIQSALFRIFGSIPGPLIFGALFDGACREWQEDCGRRGNCWVYDNDRLSLTALALAVPCLIVATIFFFLAWLTYPKSTTDDSKKLESKEGSDQNIDKPHSRGLVTFMASSRHRSESTCSEDVLLDTTVENELAPDDISSSSSESSSNRCESQKKI